MTPVVAQARLFAVEAHGEQRYGNQPYVVHLDAVAELLTPFGEQAQVVGYLHDVVEDTPVSIDIVRLEFGEQVATCVALVTDEQGPNRRERKAKTNAKLTQVSDENSLALIVKAADRLANLRTSTGGNNDSKLEMYRGEHVAFREAVYRPGLCDDLWQEMDRVLSKV
jgi:(p)ppGpp synthase/HD superfamily hydrolase